jgi:processive 1,2-diacylglycerol beta-glucosyltransferase
LTPIDPYTYEPIPGQEEANVDYVVEHGAAVRARDVSSLVYKLRLLIRNPERLQTMSRRASDISHPDAAMVVVGELTRWSET